MRFVTVTVVDPTAPADVSPLRDIQVAATDTREAIRTVVDELCDELWMTPTYTDHADGSADVLVTCQDDGTTIATLSVTTS